LEETYNLRGLTPGNDLINSSTDVGRDL